MKRISISKKEIKISLQKSRIRAIDQVIADHEKELIIAKELRDTELILLGGLI